jgi:hypothetical protein
MILSIPMLIYLTGPSLPGVQAEKCGARGKTNCGVVWQLATSGMFWVVRHFKWIALRAKMRIKTVA